MSIGEASEAPEEFFAPTCIQKIEVHNNSILKEEVDQISTFFKKKYEGTCLSPKNVEKIAKALCEEINHLYMDNNYLTSRAIPAAVRDGVIRVDISEGELRDIIIENEKGLWLRSSYIRKRIKLGAQKPLNFTDFENQLRLLKMDPLIDHIEASLKPTGERGKSDLGVRVKEASRIYLKTSFDNNSPPSIGSNRLGIEGSLRNASGFGDQFSGSYYRTTTGGGELFDVSYSLPLNAMEGKLQLRGGRYWTKTTDSDFEDLDIEGDKNFYEIYYRQPLIRTYSNELALSFGFTYQDGQTFVFGDIGTPFGIGPDDNGVSRTSVVKFGQEFIHRGPTRTWSVRSQFNFGTRLFNATQNSDPIPDGKFLSWLGQGYLGQRLGARNVLIVQAALQLAKDGLLASEQFVIGGSESVRGYRQNVRIGDNGFRFSIEDRILLLKDKAGRPVFEIRPFVDIGSVWNVSDNPNQEPEKRFLIGAGVGLEAGLGALWKPLQDFRVRLDYGYPFMDVRDQNDNLQDNGFYFSVTYEPDQLIEKLF